MNTYLQLIKEKVENIKKQKKIEKEVKNTVKEFQKPIKTHKNGVFKGHLSF